MLRERHSSGDSARLRRLTPAEIEFVVGRVVDALAAAWVQAGREPIEAAQSAREHIEKHRPPQAPVNRFKKMVVGGEEVGSLWFEHHEEAGGGHLYLVWIEVDERSRGSGHGATALELLEEVARECGTSFIEPSVFSDNAAALRLYARMGYVLFEAHEGRQVLRKLV